MAGVPDRDGARIAVGLDPLRRHPMGLGSREEGVLGRRHGLVRPVARLGHHFFADVGPCEAGYLGHGHHAEAGQLGLVRPRQARRKFGQGVLLQIWHELKEDVLDGHFPGPFSRPWGRL